MEIIGELIEGIVELLAASDSPKAFFFFLAIIILGVGIWALVTYC